MGVVIIDCDTYFLYKFKALAVKLCYIICNMARVTLIQVVYNSRRFIPPVFEAALKQTYKDTEFVAIFSGNDDGGKEYIQEHFPQVKIIDPGYNIGFSKGHNDYFAKSDSEFFQLVNPDLIMSPDYVEKMLKAFDDPNVGAATGKLLRYDFDAMKALDIIDTTGVAYSRSGRGWDRGQHEVDKGQYDNKTAVISVSGAGPMYRKSALEQVKNVRDDGTFEYYDADFHSYWEDVDLGLRMTNIGLNCVFVPNAVAWHGRAASSSPGGYKKIFSFIGFHNKIRPDIRQLNYRNHIFMFIKNSPKWYAQFFVRELAMLAFVLVFETATLKSLPRVWKLLPSMMRKRRKIQAERKISVDQFEQLLS